MFFTGFLYGRNLPATQPQPAGNLPATPGKDNLAPAHYVHNENPSLVALGKKCAEPEAPHMVPWGPCLALPVYLSVPMGRHLRKSIVRGWGMEEAQTQRATGLSGFANLRLCPHH